MKIITFGNCCSKSKQNHLNAVEAAKKSGIEEEVINISDMNQMLEMGVMASPAIMINNVLVSSGRLLKEDKIIKLIEKHKD